MTSRDQRLLEKQAAVLEMMRPEIPLDVYYNLLVAWTSSSFEERVFAEQAVLQAMYFQVTGP
jgi:hypothetical protein